MGPRVAFVGDQLVDDGDGRRFVVPAGVAVFEGPTQGGRLGEVGTLAEEAPDLEVGVLSRLDLAKQLHDEAVAEHDGAVALVGPWDVHLERRPVGREQAPEPPEGRVGVARECGVALDAPALGDDVEEIGTEGGHERRVVEQRRLLLARGSSEHGHDRLGGVAHERVGLFAFGDPQGDNVRIRVTFRVRHGDERHRDAVGEGNGRGDADRGNLAFLASEPSSGPQPRPQHAFETAALPPGENRFPRAGHGDGGRDPARGRDIRGVAFERQPHEPVGTQRQ